jgi:NAD-dependent SIR2 family protein deacetylase
MKTAIFLGAGASASEGAPLQNKLFQEYFKLCRSGSSQQHSEMERELATFFALMFDIDVDHGNLDNTEFPTFEEALGVLDLADLRNESFRDFSNLNVASNSGRLKFLRIYLTLLMAKTIHEKLSTSRNLHGSLVRNLINKNKLKDVFFLSTNYDILIDNALTNLYPQFSLDYGIDFVNFKENDDWKAPSNNSVKLFKIHGSLNWLYCPTCNNVRLTPKEKGVIKLLVEDNYSLNQSYCRVCETIYSPIIVPPTFYKDFTNVFLNLVWNKSEQSLLDTEHLIFCGYSFPDADMHIKYLIKRIQKNRRKAPIKISIVNNHPGKSDLLKEQEKNRYKRFLSQTINYTDISFEQFANNPGLLIT